MQFLLFSYRVVAAITIMSLKYFSDNYVRNKENTTVNSSNSTCNFSQRFSNI